MDIFKTFATNETLEKEGRDVTLGDSTFRIARAFNPNFNRVYSSLYEQQKAAITQKVDKDKAEAAALDVLIKAQAKTVLVGWDNVVYNGEPLEYSEANAAKLLALKDFRSWVDQQAQDMNGYLLHQEEDEAKN